MPRNTEVIRQWTILRDLEASRRLTIDEMAARTGVTTRTIRRDLEALQEAGFPLYDEVHDGKKFWRLEQRAFRKLDETGFTLAELSALYFSRTLLECLAGTPFQTDVRSAFDKLGAALTPGMRQFLDRLPLAVQAKAEPGSRAADGERLLDPKQVAARSTRIAQLLDAILHHRRVVMQYDSFSSGRLKEYAIDPHRLIFAQGGLYLMAYVPEYEAMRTFSVDRIRSLSVTDTRFEPRPMDEEAFAHSLGVHQGTPPERIEVEFDPQIARYVKERLWHDSQELTDLPDGRVRLGLVVSNDRALRSWILSFGPLARVTAPDTLVEAIRAELEAARELYEAREP